MSFFCYLLIELDQIGDVVLVLVTDGAKQGMGPDDGIVALAVSVGAMFAAP